MSAMRRRLVQAAYEAVQSAEAPRQSRGVFPRALAKRYDASRHPAVVAGALRENLLRLDEAQAAFKDTAPGTPERIAAEDRIAFLKVLLSA